MRFLSQAGHGFLEGAIVRRGMHQRLPHRISIDNLFSGSGACEIRQRFCFCAGGNRGNAGADQIRSPHSAYSLTPTTRIDCHTEYIQIKHYPFYHSLLLHQFILLDNDGFDAVCFNQVAIDLYLYTDQFGDQVVAQFPRTNLVNLIFSHQLLRIIDLAD